MSFVNSTAASLGLAAISRSFPVEREYPPESPIESFESQSVLFRSGLEIRQGSAGVVTASKDGQSLELRENTRIQAGEDSVKIDNITQEITVFNDGEIFFSDDIWDHHYSIKNGSVSGRQGNEMVNGFVDASGNLVVQHRRDAFYRETVEPFVPLTWIVPESGVDFPPSTGSAGAPSTLPEGPRR